MKTTITQIHRLIGLSFAIILLTLFQTNAQGSPDAPFSSSIVSGEKHATLKVHSNGYSADTTEIKLTNMDSFGVGTEFILRSRNENGLVISSNSDLVGNTTDNIVTFEPDGELVFGGYAGAGTRHLSIDNTGRLLASPSNIVVVTNLNTPPVNVTVSAWSPVGPSYVFVKQYDHTVMEAVFSSIVDYTASSAFGVRFRVQIDGISIFRWSAGAVNVNTVPDFTVAKSVFQNLPAGNYTVQVHARSLTGNATNVFLDPNGLGGAIWIEERL